DPGAILIDAVGTKDQLYLPPHTCIHQIREVFPPLNGLAQERRVRVGKHQAIRVSNGNVGDDSVRADPRFEQRVDGRVGLEQVLEFVVDLLGIIQVDIGVSEINLESAAGGSLSHFSYSLSILAGFLHARVHHLIKVEGGKSSHNNHHHKRDGDHQLGFEAQRRHETSDTSWPLRWPFLKRSRTPLAYCATFSG